MKTLLCIFNGEFGWEVAQWQGYCRKVSRKYDKTYVIPGPGHGYLYQDFAEIVTPEMIQKLGGLPRTNAILSWIKDRVYPDSEQEFRKFGEFTLKNGLFGEVIPQYDVLIHARNDRITFKNYPVKWWYEIVDLLKEKNLSIACIGKLGAAYELEGVESKVTTFFGESTSLKDTAKIIASAKVVVGPSSGPIHLAQHCGTPVVSWADNKIYMGKATVKQRLETQWNPFKAPAIVLEDPHWKPKPEDVVSSIMKVITKKQVTKELVEVESCGPIEIIHDTQESSPRHLKECLLKACGSGEPPQESIDRSYVAVLSNTKMFGGGERSACYHLEMIREIHVARGFSLTPESKKPQMRDWADYRTCNAKHQIWVMNDFALREGLIWEKVHV